MCALFRFSSLLVKKNREVQKSFFAKCCSILGRTGSPSPMYILGTSPDSAGPIRIYMPVLLNSSLNFASGKRKRGQTTPLPVQLDFSTIRSPSEYPSGRNMRIENPFLDLFKISYSFTCAALDAKCQSSQYYPVRVFTSTPATPRRGSGRSCTSVPVQRHVWREGARRVYVARERRHLLPVHQYLDRLYLVREVGGQRVRERVYRERLCPGPAGVLRL